MENFDFLKSRWSLRSTIVLTAAVLTLLPALSFAQYYKSKQSGNWSDASTWSYQANQPFGAWVDATTPPGNDALNIIITNENVVTLTSDISVANQLTIGGTSSFEKGTLNLATYRLTLTLNQFSIAYPSAILSTIASETSYGNIYSTHSGDVDFTEIRVTVTKDAGFTPSGNGTLNIINLTNGSISYTYAPPTIHIPSGSEWSSNLSGGTLSVSYSFPTQLSTSKSSSYAYASNGKLIYSGGEVYNVSGIKVASAADQTEVGLKSGVYYVKSGNRVQKVLVK